MSTLSGKNQNVPLPSGREKGGKGAGPRATNPADLPLPMGPSFTVARGDLVRAITRAARRAGVVVLCAPRGFGKTALLLQYADEVRRDPGRGSARIVDARGALPEELLLQIEEAETECPAAVRPLVAIDNLPVFDDEAYRMLAQRVREMRDRDAEVLIACAGSCASWEIRRSSRRASSSSIRVSTLTGRVCSRSRASSTCTV